MMTSPLAWHHRIEWHNAGLEKNKNPHQHRQREAVEKNIAQNAAFLAIPVRGRARDHDALGIHHFAHDAAGTVRRRHENG